MNNVHIGMGHLWSIQRFPRPQFRIAFSAGGLGSTSCVGTMPPSTPTLLLLLLANSGQSQQPPSLHALPAAQTGDAETHWVVDRHTHSTGWPRGCNLPHPNGSDSLAGRSSNPPTISVIAALPTTGNYPPVSMWGYQGKRHGNHCLGWLQIT